MAEQPNISSILAALTAQRPPQPPAQAIPSYPSHNGGPNPAFPQYPPPNLYNSTPQMHMNSAFPMPQPGNPGGVNVSNIKPVNSGTVSIADAIAKARNIAAEKGISYDRNRDSSSRTDNRSRSYRRSHSRSPPPARRDDYRDNYNPYRDERRDGRDRDYRRDRSYSPDRRGKFSSPPRRSYTRDRSPPGDSDNVETIQIEASLVGLVIGRGGESMRRIEQESGARVQFITGPNDSAGANRDCKISGDLRQRNKAKFEIDRICKENRGVTGVILKTQGGQPGTNQPALRDGEDSMQIMVPDRTVGLIIGRGGETIRDLQEKSGCHINIVGENKSVNGHRPVNLIGSVQAAANARALIAEIVDSDNKTHGSTGGQSRDGGFDNPPRAAFNDQRNDKVSDFMRVPAEAIGMIIGKGGETIRDMQNGTGAKINVSSDTSQRDREIGLVGTRDAIEQAKRAIDEKVDAALAKRSGANDSRRNDQYGGPSGGGGYGQSSNPNQTPLPTQTPAQQSGPQANAGSATDPYAQYGGYQNYVQMWYQAMAQQQQQGQGGDGGKPVGAP